MKGIRWFFSKLAQELFIKRRSSLKTKQGKKVCKVTALRCYQCFSLHFLLSCWQQQSGYQYHHRNSYTGELLTAPERSKNRQAWLLLGRLKYFGKNSSDSTWEFKLKCALIFYWMCTPFDHDELQRLEHLFWISFKEKSLWLKVRGQTMSK